MEREQGQGPSALGGSQAGPPVSKQVREPSGELLGSYVLLTELARGELTTVHLAKKQGPLGFQRLVAVKRLRPEHAGQAASVKLLVDEARLTAGLHHANLVGVHDVGSEGGCYVISDYVEGENLERLLTRAGAAGDPRFVLPVLVDALNGLHAIHNAVADDDSPLDIVHQAPCARHIVVGIDGVARLTDFSQVTARGIAPSRVRSERLRVAYMAPEQALDPERVDQRADLFIVGITLWEALTGERLFAAESDERSFQNLLHRRIPRPSEVGMCPPRSFDAICMRALERDPEARFASALEMARELRDVALNQALYALPGEIGAWVKSVMGRELMERRRKLGDMNSQEISLAGVHSESRADARRDDPYGNGRIYGGSGSMVMSDDGVSSDPDKTPVHAQRERPGLFPIQRDEEPTAPRYLAFHSLNEIPRPPRRARISTPPYGAFSDSVVAKMPAPRDAQDSAVVEKPQEPSASARPGAYSHVAASHRNRFSKAPSSPSVPPPVQRSDAPQSNFDELQTGRHSSVSAVAEVPRSPSLPPRGPSLPPPSRKASLPPPLPRRSTPAVETNKPIIDHRRDSIPSRLAIPADPVGVPHGAKPGVVAEGLPPTFESLRAGTFGGELILPQAPAPMGPSSLTPPNTAERTVPPEPPLEEARQRSTGMLWGSGALAAIILLAAGVGLRQWVQGPARSVTASSSESASRPNADAPGVLPDAREQEGVPSVEAKDPNATAPVKAVVTADRPGVLPASAGELKQPSNTGVEQRLGQREAKATPGSSSLSVDTSGAAREQDKAKPAATQTRVEHPLPDAATTSQLARSPRAKGGEQGPAPVVTKPKSAPKSPIPDNPY